MDIISTILFILTLVLIGSIVFFDLSRYKYHYFGAIIVLGVGLYTYGLIYQDPNPNYLDVVLKAFGNTSQILRGIFRTSDIMPRINNDVLFLISAYAIHVLGFGYTYVLVFAIFFKNLNLRMRFHLQKWRSHILVLADDDRLKYFLEAYQFDHKHAPKRAINLALSKRLQASKDIKTNYQFKPGVTTFDSFHQPLSHLLGKHQGSSVVSLISQDEAVLALIEQLNRFFKLNPKSPLTVHVLYEQEERLRVYESFNQFRDKVHFFSYAQLVSQAFIVDFPLTRLLPLEYINPEKATLKKVSIRYHMIGMGETNVSLYKHLFVTNQFPQTQSSILPKDWFGQEPVQYHLYGTQPSMDQLLLNTDIYKTSKQFLPFPQLSSSTTYHRVDHTPKSVIHKIKDSLLKSIDFQVIVIAFGSDLDNLSILQEVRDLVLKFRLFQSVRIFVHMTNKDYVEGSSLFEQSFVEAFGQGTSVYRTSSITNPIFQRMAKNIYGLLHPKGHFATLSYSQKNAYMYEALSLRFRLNLMGCDLVIQEKGLSEKKFLELYDPFQYRPDNLDHLRAKNDADLSKYAPKKVSVRSYLAQQEHLRQSAFLLLQGFVPMRIEDLIQRGELRDDLNAEDSRITSFDGLFTIQKLLREKRSLTYPESDVLYPYFVTLDHVYAVIKQTPYKVVDKIDPTNHQTLELSLGELQDIQSHIKS
jgi:hypothetical protein